MRSSNNFHLVFIKVLLLATATEAAATAEIDLDTCSNPLGLEDGSVSASQLSASSSHEPSSVGANNGRLNVDVAGGAWCPRSLIDADAKEFIEVDFGDQPHLITAVLTQGRFGNGHGQEFSEAYFVEYTRTDLPSGHYVRHVSSTGSSVLAGNTNTYSVVENKLDPPVVANKIRIVPFSRHQRTVCMRVELKGCQYKGGITSYSASSPYKGDRDNYDLGDDSYDGIESLGKISGGLGQLTDGVMGDRKEAKKQKIIGGYSWVGWKNQSSRPLELIFSFDRARHVEAVKLDIHPREERYDLGYVSRVVMECEVAAGGKKRRSFVFERLQPTEMLEMRPSKNGKCVADSVKLLITFKGKWLAMGEVSFVSKVAGADVLLGSDKAAGENIVAPPPSTFAPFFAEKEEETDEPEIEILEESVVSSKSENETKISANDDEWESRYLGVAIGVLVTVIVLLVIVVALILHRDRLSRRRYSSVSNVSGNSQTFCGNAADNAISIYKARLFGTDDSSLSSSTTLPVSRHLPLPHGHPHHPIYSEPIFTLNKPASSMMMTATQQQQHQANNLREADFSEYASPLLLYTPSPSFPTRHQTLSNGVGSSSNNNYSIPQRQFMHHTSIRQQQHKSEPNWDVFFPPAPSGPPPTATAGDVPCYASTDICKTVGTGASPRSSPPPLSSSPALSSSSSTINPFV